MNNAALLPTERNEIFAAIKSCGLEPSEFRWEHGEQVYGGGLAGVYPCSRLIHAATKFYFEVQRHIAPSDADWESLEESMRVTYSPSEDGLVSVNEMTHWTPEWATAWARALKEQVKTPDLWASVESSQAFVHAAESENNTPFTDKEKSDLKQRVRETEKYLLTLVTLNEEQYKLVNRKFEYLEKAIERQGRSDWIHTAVGVLFTIVVGVAPKQAQELFLFAGQQIGQALGYVESFAGRLLSN